MKTPEQPKIAVFGYTQPGNDSVEVTEVDVSGKEPREINRRTVSRREFFRKQNPNQLQTT